jgi:copper resistance protein D
VWELRLALGLLLAGLLVAGDRLGRRRGADMLGWATLLLSAVVVAALAWAGHAGATPSARGEIHVVSDALHLLAAGAWLGALVPLALLFARAIGDWTWLGVAREATRRFSMLGIASVGTLLVTGTVNSWFLVGGVRGLLGTPYGRLLLLKLALFAAMVAVAAFNRQRLTPQLHEGVAPTVALRRLRRNALIETGLGLAILMVVGTLGTEPPGAHLPPDWPLPFRLDLDVLRSAMVIRRHGR